MADLSQVIQQGTERSGQLGSTLSQQGATIQGVASTQNRSMLQTKAMKMQVQGRVNELAGIYSTVAKQNLIAIRTQKGRAEKAKSNMADAINSMGGLPEAMGPDEPRDQNQLDLERLQNEYNEAESAVKAAETKQADYVYTLMKDPRATANLTASDLGSANLLADFFSEEALAGATEQQKLEIGMILASITPDTQKLSPKQEAYDKALGTQLGKRAGGWTPSEGSAPGPIAAGLAEQQSESWYYNNKENYGKGHTTLKASDVKEWGIKDTTPFYPRVNEFNDMTEQERAIFGDVLSKWDSAKLQGKSREAQVSRMKDMKDYIVNYTERDTTQMSSVGKDVLSSMLDILNAEELRPARLGHFTGLIGKYVSPREKSDPRSTLTGIGSM